MSAARLASLTEAPQAIRTLLRVDSFPYRHLVRDVMSKPAVFAPPDATMQEAVRLMVEKRREQRCSCAPHRVKPAL